MTKHNKQNKQSLTNKTKQNEHTNQKSVTNNTKPAKQITSITNKQT